MVSGLTGRTTSWPSLNAAETAGGVTIATLKKLVESGQLDPEAETVVFNTGDGLKTLDAVADRVGPAATIDPSYSAFTAIGLV